MNSIIETASKVTTPLGLGGVAVAVLFLVYRQIIKRDIFPKLTVALAGTIIQSIINKLFILALVAIFLGFTGYVVAKFSSESKSPPDSVSISFALEMSFKDAVKMIAATDSYTAVFSNCPEILLHARIEPGEFGGKTPKELIEALRYRLVDSSIVPKYRVQHFKERGIYEIMCQ